MSSIGAYEAKSHFSELLERVSSGEEITITRHGQPVARLVPFRAASTPESRRQAILQMRELSKGRSLKGLKIKDLIKAGRP
jgi:prevent-host-death family protein